MGLARQIARFLGGGKWYERYLIGLIVVTLIIGPVGFFLRNSGACTETPGWSCDARLVVDSFIRTLQLFTLRNDGAGINNWALTIARLFGAIIAFGVLGAVLIRVFTREIETFRIGNFSDHWIIAGYGEAGRGFAASCRERKYGKVVVVDPDPEGTIQSRCRRDGHPFLKGVPDTADFLTAIAAGKAAGMIIATGSDETNVSICRAVGAYLEERNKGPLEIILVLDDIRLLDHMERDPTFKARLGSRLKVTLFSLARRSAIALCERTPFVDQAIRRGQNAVHLALFGATATAVETVLQFLRLSPALGLGKPVIDWFVDKPETLIGRLSQRNGALGALARGANSGKPADLPLDWALDLRLHALPEGSDVPDPETLEAIETAGGNLTAIIIAAGDAAENLSTGLSLRERSHPAGIWAAPIYVHMRKQTALDPLLQIFSGEAARKVPERLASLKSTKDPANALEPFGAVAALCRVEDLHGQRETLARQIHAAYLRTRQQDTDDSSGARNEALLPWRDLAETYRQSNRRAADHLPVKLESAKIPVTDLTEASGLPPKCLENAGLFEALAALEHDSWRIDRELDGWRLGERDDSRKLHDNLVAYADLKEEIKEYDREQIRMLTGVRGA